MSGSDVEARRWLEYARFDMSAAQELLRTAGYLRQACFLAQQTAEKALKVALVAAEIPVLRTNDLDALRNLLPQS